MGQRIFLFDWLVLKRDIRGSTYPQGFIGISNMQNQLTAMVGVGFYIPPFINRDSSGGSR